MAGRACPYHRRAAIIIAVNSLIRFVGATQHLHGAKRPGHHKRLRQYLVRYSFTILYSGLEAAVAVLSSAEVADDQIVRHVTSKDPARFAFVNDSHREGRRDTRPWDAASFGGNGIERRHSRVLTVPTTFRQLCSLFAGLYRQVYAQRRCSFFFL